MELQALIILLQSNGIDTSLYGKAEAKTLEQLLKGVNEKECELIELPELTSRFYSGQSLIRKISMIYVIILKNNEKVLIETNQHFHQTSTRESYSAPRPKDRKRNSCLTEKLKSGETISDSLIRVLDEELGVTFGKNEECVHSIYAKTENRMSGSYPGLLTSYHQIICKIECPLLLTKEESFQHTEYFSDGSERLTTTWSWLTFEEAAEKSPLTKDYLMLAEVL